MARIGKISKLPPSIREELNLRLERAESARSILTWLNAVPAVQELLELHFKGDPVNDQNITNWRRSGYAAWQLRNDFMDQLLILFDEAADLDEAAIQNMADHAARLLSIRFAMLLSPSLSSGFQSKRSDSPPPSSGSQSKRSNSPSSSKASRTRPGSTPSTESTFAPSNPTTFDEQLANFLINLTRAVVSLRRSDHQAARLKLLLDKSRPQNPNTKKQPTPGQESFARELAAIRSRRPVTGPDADLSPLPDPQPPPPSPVPSINKNQDISTYSPATPGTQTAPAPAPQPPRTEHCAPGTKPAPLNKNQDIPTYSPATPSPTPPPRPRVRADIGDLTPAFARWILHTQSLEEARERYADREQYLPEDVQAALKGGPLPPLDPPEDSTPASPPPDQRPPRISTIPPLHPDYEPGPRPLPHVTLAGHYTY